MAWKKLGFNWGEEQKGREERKDKELWSYGTWGLRAKGWSKWSGQFEYPEAGHCAPHSPIFTPYFLQSDSQDSCGLLFSIPEKNKTHTHKEKEAQ